MGLEQLEMETGLNKVDFAIKLLSDIAKNEVLYFADSGGKDSSVTLDLLIKSGRKYEAHHCVSPIDPPTIRDFIKSEHPQTQFDYYAKNFWQMVRKKGLPMRNARWCCELIKEAGGIGRYVIVGNRRAEGSNRSKQTYVEPSRDGKKILVRPIANFDNYDIWQYIRENNISYHSLYDEGAERKGYGEGLFKRLGCVLCPFTKPDDTQLQIKYFPKIANLWLLACNDIVAERKANNYLDKRGKLSKHKFETGEELFQWWIKRR